MIQELQNIRGQLFDAPKEIKEAFNNVVKYFSVSEEKELEKLEKLYQEQKNFTFRDLARYSDLAEGYKGYYKFRDSKIPGMNNLIAIDSDSPVTYVIEDLKKSSDKKKFWDNGKSDWSKRLEVTEITTKDGNKIYHLIGERRANAYLTDKNYYNTLESLVEKRFKFKN